MQYVVYYIICTVASWGHVVFIFNFLYPFNILGPLIIKWAPTYYREPPLSIGGWGWGWGALSIWGPPLNAPPHTHTLLVYGAPT